MSDGFDSGLFDDGTFDSDGDGTPIIPSFTRPTVVPSRDAVWQVLGVNPDQTIDGEIETATTTIIRRHNALGSGLLESGFDGNLDSTFGRLLRPGAGVLVLVDSNPVISGPVTKPFRNRDGDTHTLSIGFSDDLQLLADTVAHQDPTHALALDLDSTYFQRDDDASGPAETVLKHWVDVNCGPGAVAGRQIYGLTIEPDIARGAALSWAARMDNLLELVTAKAGLSGLGVRVLRRTDGGRQFSVYAPVDKTSDVVFAVELGNVAAYQYGSQRPSANRLYVGGVGIGKDRTFRIVEDAASLARWGPIEAFLDANSISDLHRLDLAGRAQLRTTADQFFLSADIVDTGAHEWAPLTIDQTRAYDVGDTVKAVVDGQEVSEVIQEITAVHDVSGTSVTPTIGSTSQGGPPEARFFQRIIAVLRDHDRRISGQETR